MKLLWFTIHPWGPNVRSSADFMDTYWASSTFLARLTYWSVTQDILFNSRMTNLPTVSLVGILISNPSGLLFSRVCTEKKLKTSGNSSSRSFQIVRRFFSPLEEQLIFLVLFKGTLSL
jgi:hypothetical protein